MDNLTHSLIGALIGQMGLKRKSALAMPGLILAANIPDIDAFTTVLGVQSLALRRGITHGPVAIILLPILLWAIMLCHDKWREGRVAERAGHVAVQPYWLLLLIFLACLSHPALDWLNSYGIRLLEPISENWYYGDMIFIIDIWILSILILGIWISRRRENEGHEHWRVPAIAAFCVIFIYIFANAMITNFAENGARRALAAAHDGPPDLVVANPVPVLFWQREILWRGYDVYGQGHYSPYDGVMVDMVGQPTNVNLLSGADFGDDDKDVRAFLFWSRMPVVHVDDHGRRSKLVLNDQRFSHNLVRERFQVEVDISPMVQ